LKAYRVEFQEIINSTKAKFVGPFRGGRSESNKDLIDTLGMEHEIVMWDDNPPPEYKYFFLRSAFRKRSLKEIFFRTAMLPTARLIIKDLEELDVWAEEKDGQILAKHMQFSGKVNGWK
jgi:hypothetical protein